MAKRVQKYNRENYERHKEYFNEFQKTNYKMFNFKLNLKNDNDIIEKLDSVNNRTDYMKKLVRNDIKLDEIGKQGE